MRGSVLLLLLAFTLCQAAPEMKTFALGRMDAAVPTEVNTDGTCVVTASGVAATNGRDDATFAGLETEAPAFTFIARIARVDGLTPTMKIGLGMRASQWGSDRAVHLCYSAQERGLQWFLRHTSRMRDDEGGQRCFTAGVIPADAPEGLWLRLVRRYPRVEMAFSRDGRAWTVVPYQAALLAPRVLVGLQATAGGDGKQPVAVTYDHIAFTVDTAAGLDTPATFAEKNAGITGRLSLARVDDGAKGPFSAYLLMPRDMDPARIRAILFTPGNKEILLADNTLVAFDKQDQLRKPASMATYEGTCEIANLRPFYQALATHGIVRIAGIFPAGDYAKAVERLAAVSGIAHLPNIPVLTMTDTNAVGPARCLAGLGQSGADLQTPHLSVFNTQDGGPAIMASVPGARARHALWACAPQWTVGHKPSQGEAMIFPFFLEVMRLRLPAEVDLTRTAPTLTPLREEDGWLGLTDSWTTNDPQITPAAAYQGNNAVWLPTEGLARLWRATVANHPRTVIQFPIFDGNASFDQAIYPYWHDSTLAAGAPVEVVASGPTGREVQVTFYEGARPLKVRQTHGSPYRVTLEPLEPGIHSIYAESVVDGVREVSHPVLVTVVPAQG